MALSVLDLFTVGIGPSASHTVGPMRAARVFAEGLADDDLLSAVTRARVELYGSLGATGHGHGSDRAVILGLEGEDPETVDTASVLERVERVRGSERLHLLGRHDVGLAEDDLVMHRRKSLPGHPNGMTFEAFDASGPDCAPAPTTAWVAASSWTRRRSASTGWWWTTPSYPIPSRAVMIFSPTAATREWGSPSSCAATRRPSAPGPRPGHSCSTSGR